MCRQIGSEWIRDRTSLGLTVPSVLIPAERSLILNPAHADMAHVVVPLLGPHTFGRAYTFI